MSAGTASMRAFMARIRMMLLVGVAVSACAGVVRTDFIDGHDGAYDGTSVRLAQSNEPIPLAVRGSLYPGLTDMDAANAVARHFRMPGWYSPLRFKAASLAEAQRGDYGLILVVDLAQPLANNSCKRLDRAALAPPSGEITIFAVFCSAGEMVTHSFARAGASAPGTLAFQQVVDQISFSLFPPPQSSN